MDREPRGRKLRFTNRAPSEQSNVVGMFTAEQRAQHMLKDIAETEYMEALEQARDGFIAALKIGLPGKLEQLPPYFVGCIARDAVDEFLKFVRDQAAMAPRLTPEGEM